MLVPYLKSFGPATVRVATLLQKRTPKSNGFVAEYVGFTIPDKFVVGYCLDYNEVYRDMSHSAPPPAEYRAQQQFRPYR